MARGKHEKRREPKSRSYSRGGEKRRVNRVVPRALTSIMCIALVFVLIWGAFVYSPTPFITRWREYFISSAMSTFRHQWLATSLIPASVISTVMTAAEQEQKDNEIDSSDAPPAIPEIRTTWILSFQTQAAS